MTAGPACDLTACPGHTTIGATIMDGHGRSGADLLDVPDAFVDLDASLSGALGPDAQHRLIPEFTFVSAPPGLAGQPPEDVDVAQCVALGPDEIGMTDPDTGEPVPAAAR